MSLSLINGARPTARSEPASDIVADPPQDGRRRKHLDVNAFHATSFLVWSAELTFHGNQMKKIIIFITTCLPWYVTMSESVDVRDTIACSRREADPRAARTPPLAGELESIHPGRSAAISYSH